MNKFLCGALLLPLYGAAAYGQAAATLDGAVLDPGGDAVPGAVVELSQALSGFHRETQTDGDGTFSLANVPFQDYVLRVESAGFMPHVERVALRSARPVAIEVELDFAVQIETVDVQAFGQLNLLDLTETGTKTQLDRRIIEKLPVPPSVRGLEAILLAFPGFAANANGAIHPRGAHNQMSYVVDGMPISDQFSGQFATSIDPSLVQSLELFTGNIPAEYGSKVSGVANVTTRSGLDGGGRRFLEAGVGAAGYDTLMQSTQAGGATDTFGWFGSLSAIKSNRFLDSPSFDNLHNGGNAQRGSLRFDWRATDRDSLRLSSMLGRSSFQLANLRSQHLAGQEQRRLLDDVSVGFGYVRVLSPSATFDSVTSYRDTASWLSPSPRDTPVTASLFRTLATLSTFNRFRWRLDSHDLQIGLDGQYFPVSEWFEFGLTSPAANHSDSDEYNPNLLLHDLSRGGQPFFFNESRSGSMLTGFVRDRVTMGSLSLDLGLRLDRYSMVVRETSLQPRVGLAYHLEMTGTVLRASYNRNLQTPPNENLLLANSPLSARLAPPEVRRAFEGGSIPIEAQLQNVYEVGLQQRVWGRATVDAAFYHKNSSSPQDNDNFLNTGIVFPTALAFSRVNGVEGQIRVPEFRGVSGTLSATHFRAIVTPPFTGGLFLGATAVDSLSEGPFVIDHDQALGISGNLIYRPRRRWWTSWQMRYDSGLVSNPSDPAEVAADPDYSDQLPYVDLLGDPPRIRPRAILDASVGYEHYADDRRVWEIAVQLSNLTNRRALYSFQSVFVGTRVVQPFTAGFKMRFFW